GAAVGRKGACCAGQDIHDARRVADRLGIPHYVLDYERRFREAVIDDFADSYLSGETPIPCVRCNQRVKFRDLIDTTRDLGAEAALRPGASRPGEIVHVDGRVLGRHAGIIHYTIGQRRGLGLGEGEGAGEPLYVVRLDPTEGRVVVGPLAALARSEVRLHGLNWLGPVPPAAERPLAVKLRSTSPPVQALVAADGAGGARVVLADPQNGVAPG